MTIETLRRYFTIIYFLKSAVAALGIVGLFGSDFLGNVNRIGDAVVKQARSPTTTTAASRNDLKTTDSTRGAMTRLTRKEINLKLQQVPVFFATEEGAEASILVQDGIGRFFIDTKGHTYIHTYSCRHIYSYIHAYIHSKMHRYSYILYLLHAYILTYIHTCHEQAVHREERR